MIPTAELTAQRRLTKYFIEADPLEIQILRSTRTADGSGGYTTSDPAPLSGGLQRMRLIPLGDGAEERTTADGLAVTPRYMLMGQHDVDMQRWDRFTLDGHSYEIVFVNANRQYEVKGEVAYLA